MSEVIRGPWKPVPPEPEPRRRPAPVDNRPAYELSLSQVEQALRADSGNETYRRLYKALTGRSGLPDADAGFKEHRPFE